MKKTIPSYIFSLHPVTTCINHTFLDYKWNVSFEKKPTLDESLDRSAVLVNENLIAHGNTKLSSTTMWSVCDPCYLTIGCSEFDCEDVDVCQDYQEGLIDWLEED